MHLDSITKMRLAAFLLAVAGPFVAAQNPGFFTNPPVGINQNDYNFDPVWYLGETQIVSWSTVFSNYTITLWQETLPGGSATPGPAIISIAPGSTGVNQFPWTVTNFAFDLRVSPVFFFWLTPGTTPGLVPQNGQLSSTSRYFNISAKAPVSSTTSTSSSVSSIATSSPTTSAPPRETTSASPSPTSAASGLSTGAKVGIAFGAVILAAIIIGAAIFFALRNRKKEERADVPPRHMPQREPQEQYVFEERQKAGDHAELQAERPLPRPAGLGRASWRLHAELS